MQLKILDVPEILKLLIEGSKISIIKEYKSLWVIAVYHGICFAFVDRDPLQDKKSRGPMNVIDLLVNDIHQFVAFVKK